jgi:leishmanolysin-like peptidase
MFNCTTLDSVELENEGTGASTMQHWDRRDAGTEYMTANYVGTPVISNLTLALLEDTGWYKVDYAYGERLAWGADRGCGFVLGD